MQTTSATFASTVNGLMNIIGSLVWLLGGVAIAVFLYGCVRFISKAADTHEHARGYDMMKWGLVALFVFFSLGGLIVFLQQSVFPESPSQGFEPQTSVGGTMLPVTSPPATNLYQ